MKRIIFAVAALALVLAGVSSAEEKKIAVFDAKKCFDAYEVTKTYMKKLEEMQDAKKKEADVKKKEIEDMTKNYLLQKSMLSDDAKKTKEQDIMAKTDAYQKMAGQMIQDIQKESNNMTEAVIANINAAAEKVAKEMKYDLLFEKKALVYGGEDITDKVIAKLNEKK